MQYTTPTEMDRGSSQPNEPLEASVWHELQRACHALGGARGPRRRVAKQELTAALERRQRFSEGRVEGSSPAGPGERAAG